MADTTRVPAIEGWFTTGDDGAAPALLGSRCTECGTYAFPAERRYCGNPDCGSTTFETVELSRRGRIWSYTDARYQPPPPYVAADPYVPFCLAAVELAAEKLVVMGQVVPGVTVDDLTVGDEVELVIDTLYSEDGCDYLVWKWRPVGSRVDRSWRGGLSVSDDKKVAVLGAGMHEWGKWGRPFVEYGLAAARDAMADAGLGWRDMQFVSGADTIRNGYPGFVSGATFAQALGWTGARVSSVYAACASGAVAIANARAQILAGLCDVALVVGADTTPKGFFAPVGGGERKDDPDWLRFHLMGATNPTYFGLYARRRMDRFGATEEDFAQVKVKNARHGLANPYARYRKEVTVDEVLASPMVADPLRLLEICATSDGGAALVLTSMDFARRHAGGAGPLVTIDAVSTVTPTFPNTVIEMPNFSTDSAAATTGPTRRTGLRRCRRGFRPSIATAAYAEAGIGPEDVSLAEVYDLSSALELDWYEDIGLCGEGEAEKLLRDGATTLGGRVPVNPSGGLSCFGEAIPAQAIAQVCECVWQLRGTATGHQVEGARVAVTANQGLFGHGSSVLLSR